MLRRDGIVKEIARYEAARANTGFRRNFYFLYAPPLLDGSSHGQAIVFFTMTIFILFLLRIKHWL